MHVITCIKLNISVPDSPICSPLQPPPNAGRGPPVPHGPPNRRFSPHSALAPLRPRAASTAALAPPLPPPPPPPQPSLGAARTVPALRKWWRRATEPSCSNMAGGGALPLLRSPWRESTCHPLPLKRPTRPRSRLRSRLHRRSRWLHCRTL